MKKQQSDTCYICGEKASTREHVPPLCFFPEKKDIGHDKFRKNLITVPSCDLHNSKKTKDDEYLMACLAGVVGNNAIGYFHNKTKVKRALERKHKEFINRIMKNPEDYVLTTKDGSRFPLIMGHPDYERLINCFKQIALGLYYHEFKSRFDGECNFILGFIKYRDRNQEKLKELIEYKYKNESKDWPLEKGANPDVFRYHFGVPDIFGLIPLKMTFYAGTNVYASFMPNNSKKPFDLGIALINSGVKTIINLEDGKSIEFN